MPEEVAEAEKKEIQENFLNTALVFEEHDFIDPQRDWQILFPRMYKNLKKDCRNIYFLEYGLASEDFKKFKTLFKEALSPEGDRRYTKAFTTALIQQNDPKAEITETRVKNAISYLIDNLRDAPFEENIFTNIFLNRFRVIDQYESEGYKIDVLFEEGVEMKDFDSEKLNETLSHEGTLPESDGALLEFAKFIRDRDTKIIKQAEAVMEEANRSRQKTNLIVTLGQLHSEIVTRLPKSLLSTLDVSYSDISGERMKDLLSDPQSRTWFEIQSKLVHNDPITHEDWNKLRHS